MLEGPPSARENVVRQNSLSVTRVNGERGRGPKVKETGGEGKEWID